MCDCIRRIEKMLNEKMVDQNPGCEIVDEVWLGNQAVMFHNGERQLFSPATGRYMQGKRTRKFEPSMYYTYCPFCGKKYDNK